MLLNLLWRARRHLGLVAAGAAVLTVAAGGALFALEADAVTSFGDGLWWAVSLMTTVGFVGDSPHTVGGRIVAAFLMVVGFGLMSLVTAAVSSFFVSHDQQPEIEHEIAAGSAVAAQLAELTAAVTRLTEQNQRLEERLGRQD